MSLLVESPVLVLSVPVELLSAAVVVDPVLSTSREVLIEPPIVVSSLLDVIGAVSVVVPTSVVLAVVIDGLVVAVVLVPSVLLLPASVSAAASSLHASVRA